MKTYVHVFLVAACLVACARALPGARRDPFNVDDADDSSVNFNYNLPNFDSYFNDFVKSFWRNLNSFSDYFEFTHDFKIPEGANTTSTTKIIDGLMVTINETTYSSDDDNTAFRIRIIDVKPQNDTGVVVVDATTARPVEAAGSAETVEDFNNEISKNTDTLTA